MRARRIVTISLLLILCGLHETSRAQSRSLFGSSGPTTQATLGGSRSSFYSSPSGGFGTAQPFGTQGFGSGFGNTGFGTGTGFGGAGTGMGFGGTQFGSSLGAGAGFVGLNNTAQGFVGMQQTGQTGGRGFGTQFGGGQFGSQFGGGQFGSQFGGRGRTGSTQFQQFDQSNNQRGATNQIQLPVRPQIAFEYPQPPPAVIATSLDAQIGRIADRGPAFRGIRFAVDGTVVTLTGFVPDENTRRVAAALVRLEPGVRSVQNELVVAPPPSPIR